MSRTGPDDSASLLSNDDLQCPVCLCDASTQALPFVSVLPCKHQLCIACARACLVSSTAACPLCRSQLFPEAQQRWTAAPRDDARPAMHTTWYYSSRRSGKWWQYDTPRQAMLEQAYAKDPHAVFEADVGPYTFVFDLANMRQTRKNTSFVRRMKRQSSGGAAVGGDDAAVTRGMACVGVSGLVFEHDKPIPHGGSV